MPPSVFVGIDVSKAKLDVALRSADQTDTLTIENSTSGIAHLIGWLRSKAAEQAVIVVESTGSDHWLVCLELADAQCDVRLINPLLTKQYQHGSLRDAKTDRIDALRLSEIAQLERNLPVFLDSRETLAEKRYQSLLAQLQHARQHLHHSYQDALEAIAAIDVDMDLSCMRDTLDVLESAIATLKSMIERSADDLARQVADIPGVSLLQASVLSGAVRGRTFATRDQFTAFFGLDVRARQSGKWHGQGSLSKRGNPFHRKILFQLGWSLKQHNAQYQAYYKSLVAREQHYFTCILATARKFLREFFRIYQHSLAVSLSLVLGKLREAVKGFEKLHRDCATIPALSPMTKLPVLQEKTPQPPSQKGEESGNTPLAKGGQGVLPSIHEDDTLLAFLAENSHKPYRAAQIAQAIFHDRVEGFDEMTTLPEELRKSLEETFRFFSLSQWKVQQSKVDSTTKALFKTHDNRFIESVLMRHLSGRNTVCVSSQVGCPLACTFCATGKLGFHRNLEFDEIVDQILFFERLLKKEKSPQPLLKHVQDRLFLRGVSRKDASKQDRDFDAVEKQKIQNQKIPTLYTKYHIPDTASPAVRNVVFMGMGEPMLNYENVIKAIAVLNDPKKLNKGARHITISTAGLIPGINKLTKAGIQVKLAISLHAPNDELRSELMPINRRYHLDDLMKSLDAYVEKTNKRIFYEYVMLRGVNDKPEHAHELGKLLQNRLAHVNLIPWNAVRNSPYETTPRDVIKSFQTILESYNVPGTVRVTLGLDIDAACGQLAEKGQSWSDESIAAMA